MQMLDDFLFKIKDCDNKITLKICTSQITRIPRPMFFECDVVMLATALYLTVTNVEADVMVHTTRELKCIGTVHVVVVAHREIWRGKHTASVFISADPAKMICSKRNGVYKCMCYVSATDDTTPATGYSQISCEKKTLMLKNIPINH